MEERLEDAVLRDLIGTYDELRNAKARLATELANAQARSAGLGCGGLAEAPDAAKVGVPLESVPEALDSATSSSAGASAVAWEPAQAAHRASPPSRAAAGLLLPPPSPPMAAAPARPAWQALSEEPPRRLAEELHAQAAAPAQPARQVPSLEPPRRWLAEEHPAARAPLPPPQVRNHPAAEGPAVQQRPPAGADGAHRGDAAVLGPVISVPLCRAVDAPRAAALEGLADAARKVAHERARLPAAQPADGGAEEAASPVRSFRVASATPPSALGAGLAGRPGPAAGGLATPEEARPQAASGQLTLERLLEQTVQERERMAACVHWQLEELEEIVGRAVLSTASVAGRVPGGPGGCCGRGRSPTCRDSPATPAAGPSRTPSPQRGPRLSAWAASLATPTALPAREGTPCSLAGTPLAASSAAHGGSGCAVQTSVATLPPSEAMASEPAAEVAAAAARMAPRHLQPSMRVAAPPRGAGGQRASAPALGGIPAPGSVPARNSAVAPVGAPARGGGSSLPPPRAASPERPQPRRASVAASPAPPRLRSSSPQRLRPAPTATAVAVSPAHAVRRVVGCPTVLVSAPPPQVAPALAMQRQLSAAALAPSPQRAAQSPAVAPHQLAPPAMLTVPIQAPAVPPFSVAPPPRRPAAPAPSAVAPAASAAGRTNSGPPPQAPPQPAPEGSEPEESVACCPSSERQKAVGTPPNPLPHTVHL